MVPGDISLYSDVAVATGADNCSVAGATSHFSITTTNRQPYTKHKCLQCFDAVGWAAGRASGLQKLSGGVLAWLSAWGEVQICIWRLADAIATLAPMNPDWFLPFWYWFTQVVQNKGPLNRFLSVTYYTKITIKISSFTITPVL